MTKQLFCQLAFAALIGLPSLAIAQTPKVVVIGVDGLGGVYAREAATQYLDRLQELGSYTYEMQNVLPVWSAPNWASMISGSTPTRHGISSNDHSSPSRVTTLFKALAEQAPDLNQAVIYEWDGFIDLIETSVPFATKIHAGEEEGARVAIELLKRRQPDLLFVHLDFVDHAGHGHGWGGSNYLRAIGRADEKIGRLFAAAKAADPDTYFIVTADHGGYHRNHNYDRLDCRSIPFFIIGPGIKAGHQITAHARIWDLAPTVAKIFGLKPPAPWIGKPVPSVFTDSPNQPVTGTLGCGTTRNFSRLYWDRGTGADSDLSVWRPAVPAGKTYVAQTAVSNYASPKAPALIFEDDPELLSAPIGYERLSDDSGSGGDEDVTYWRPIPRAGFTCLSDLAVRNYTSPPEDAQFRCVKTELITAGSHEWVWFDTGSGAGLDTGIWNGKPTDAPSVVATFAFRARQSHFEFGYNLFNDLNSAALTGCQP